jgi:hypothetical protein
MGSRRQGTRDLHDASDGSAWPRLAGPVLLLTISLLRAGPAVAQAPPADNIHYSQKRDFYIPFQADDRRIREVQLYVSEGSGRPWQPAATAPPGPPPTATSPGSRFQFHANRDGWFFFSVRTVDTAGRAYPERPEQLQPSMKVCVDTVAPTVSLKPTPRDNGVGVEWQVSDDNLDISTLRLDYRLAGGTDWTPLTPQQVSNGQHAWNPGTNSAVEVRLQVKDKAGNLGQDTTTVTPGDKTRPLPGGGSDQTSKPAPVNGIRYVNSTNFGLNYQITDVGKSKVAAIELWVTRDGKEWRRHAERASEQPPFPVEVTEEGRYGFILIGRSGAGLSEPPPKLGDPPHVVVEVDLTKPKVTLQSVDVGKGPQSGTLSISYTAIDANIERRPITISYAENPAGPWTPIVKGEENKGTYLWRMPAELPSEVYIRVEAVDKAGNIGSAETANKVVVDLSVPKVRVIDVTPVTKP